MNVASTIYFNIVIRNPDKNATTALTDELLILIAYSVSYEELLFQYPEHFLVTLKLLSKTADCR